MVKFDSFSSLPEPVLRALVDMGFTDASPIQGVAIPVALQGADIIAQAQTGTGKTAAFGIPLVMAALAGKPSLVLVPTRELAQQVTAELDRIGLHAGVKALALYGGASFGDQARAIDRGEADILVATPGRLTDHIGRGTLKPSVAKLVVLDEADEMLKMGFIDEVEEILRAVGPERQTMLFSATMPEPIVRLAERYLKDPQFVSVAAEESSIANANTEQWAVAVDHREKLDALIRILAVERPTGTLVFRHTREQVDELVVSLRQKGIRAAALHGGFSQKERDTVVDGLREGVYKLVVATNVAARGLDIDTISIVVNFDAPREAESYVHRIGRTGRAGREGKSFLFVTPADRGRLRGIERVLGGRIQWTEVPTDEEVEAAVAANTQQWLGEQILQIKESHRLIVADLVAKGADPAALAAKLLGIVAKHEGLTPPPMEPRRARRSPAPMANRNNAARGGQRIAIMMSVGRDDGVRPGDVVGALTNEGGLVGADIGRIDILPRMVVAEVPEQGLDDVFQAMASATIRGRRVDMRVAHNWQFRAPPALRRN
ncbi:MAG TPA: DEAD/DEAH box helicase [Candidatus Thermoplasmatota archaeon]|nr:DEAD/DEAH box helicase [Candidatus Thermoplasmatota archaeon]